jgi:inorganic pyrophosphatase
MSINFVYNKHYTICYNNHVGVIKMITENYIGKIVKVKMDRPLGTKHPKWGYIYETNYGFIPNTISGDGEELDVYVLGVRVPLNEFTGRCIAVIHRTNDNDDKLIVVPDGVSIDNDTIEKQISFQEKWFNHIIIRNNQ